MEDARLTAAKVGYPVMIKASAGGGGRGMRAANNEEELGSLFTEAQTESETAFGSNSMYIERFMKHPHHVEIQIIADHRGNTVSLGARDCSLQRKHQKVIEESPVCWMQLRRDGNFSKSQKSCTNICFKIIRFCSAVCIAVRELSYLLQYVY